jgi:hypothetical protein
VSRLARRCPQAFFDHRALTQRRQGQGRQIREFGRKPKLTQHQQREAIRRRDRDGETLRSIARSYVTE